jgi:exonuclease SbcD
MKILHTSDWHLGRTLYGRKRYDEFAAFLDWLADTIETQKIDILLVAGDVFDTTTPGNRAQALYYRFLYRVSASRCSHVVVIAGNHDSPSFLDAPAELLKALNVHVVGDISDNPADEVILVSGSNQPALVCAVPYLRDRDIRTVEPGETMEDKNSKLVAGIRQHYGDVVAAAERKRTELFENLEKTDPVPHIPIIALGHLFTAGGKTVDGDGVRDLYVGSLAHVDKNVFPAAIDYLALGHLHVAQKVGGAQQIRYSGSPIPMGFGEAGRSKQVVIVEIASGLNLEKKADESGKHRAVSITEHPVPCFQELARITGSLDEICEKIDGLKQAGSRAWLEIEYTGRDLVAGLREVLDEALTNSGMEIRRIKNKPVMDRVFKKIQTQETLDDLDPKDVFDRCLEAEGVTDEDRRQLTAAYQEIVTSLLEEDKHAE